MALASDSESQSQSPASAPAVSPAFPLSSTTGSSSIPSHPNNNYNHQNPHPAWTGTIVPDHDEEGENMNRYVAGGFHFVRLGEILDGRYIIVHKLGKGGYAVVWLCWDQVEYCYVSLKICCAQKETEIETETVSSELAIYQHLQNFDYTKHFICPLLRHFYITGPNGVHLCMIFPVAGPNVRQNCTESNRVTTIERTVAAQYFGRQLAHAVAFLHAIGVVHGDLNSNNILTKLEAFPNCPLDELYEIIWPPNRLKPHFYRKVPESTAEYVVSPAFLARLPTTNTILIIDFGEAFFIDNPPARGLHTPYPFRAPECAFLQEKSPSSDMWAVGCLLYLWFNGLNLFGEDSLKRIIPLWIRELGPLPDKYSSRIAEIIDIKEPMKDNYGKVVDSSRPQLRDTIVEGFNWVNFHSTRPTTLSREQLIDKTHGIFPRTMPPLPTYVCTSSAASTSESLEQTQLSFAVRSCTCNSTSRAPSPSPPPPHNDLTSTLQRQLSSQATHSKDADLDDLDPLIASFPDLMAQLLDYDPRKRIPAIAMLEHRWLKSDMGGVMPWGVKLVPVADEEEKESGIRAWVYFRVG